MSRTATAPLTLAEAVATMLPTVEAQDVKCRGDVAAQTQNGTLLYAASWLLENAVRAEATLQLWRSAADLATRGTDPAEAGQALASAAAHMVAAGMGGRSTNAWENATNAARADAARAVARVWLDLGLVDAATFAALLVG